MKVSLVIPVFNEENYIDEMLFITKKALKEGIIDEALMVDDGSRDRTAEKVKASGLNMLSLPKNKGKAAAMMSGADHTTGEILLFLDADLKNFRLEHINLLIEPLKKNDELEMTIGRLIGANLVTFLGQTLTPQLSGQRAIRRKVFEKIQKVVDIEKSRFGIEVLILKFFKYYRFKYMYINLRGVSVVPKEQKEMFMKGFGYRLKMYKEILLTISMDIRKEKGKE
jgi:glycosyltransferase involved in cell wall biosynthesis